MLSILRPMRNLCLFTGLATALALTQSPAQAQEALKKEPCFLWKISSKSNSIHLLGSMHVVKADMFPLPAEMEDAYAKSGSLVVEVNTEKIDQAAMLKLVKAKGMYPPGESLSKSVSKETMDSLREYCTRKKLNAANLEPFRPWMVKMTLAVVELQAQGHSTDGIDKHFLKKAAADKKNILEMETAEEQLDLFASFPPQLQEKLLAKTLTDLAGIKELMEKLTSAWKSGDLKAMEKASFGDPAKTSPETKTMLVKMFDERNVKMAEKIEGYLNGKDSCFVVVGAGHLVGEQGILQLLRNKGFQIEQVMRVPVRIKGG